MEFERQAHTYAANAGVVGAEAGRDAVGSTGLVAAVLNLDAVAAMLGGCQPVPGVLGCGCGVTASWR